MRLMFRFLRRMLAIGVTAACGQALAWGPDGHATVGAIAEELLAGTRAGREVDTLLGGASLAQVAVWADCAKGVDPERDFRYTAAGRFPECAPFETDAGIAAMVDFVHRNHDNCDRQSDEESCHRQYHYADVAIQRRSYSAAAPGARDDDIVAATRAAIQVLRGRPAPAPFAIAGRREALILLIHYVGDLHQPLHVGAVYLAADGRRLDPGRRAPGPASTTRGGNLLQVVDAEGRADGNLHHHWDDTASALDAGHVDAARLKSARKIASSRGDAAGWPARWANGTLAAAREAFDGVSFAPRRGNNWRTTLPAGYESRLLRLQRQQLTRAGARLAQVLATIWPERP